MDTGSLLLVVCELSEAPAISIRIGGRRISIVHLSVEEMAICVT